jgi:hypothetical protein
MAYDPGEKLFIKVRSSQAFENQRQKIGGEVAALTEAVLLGNPIEDVLGNFLARAEIEPLPVGSPELVSALKEVCIAVRQIPRKSRAWRSLIKAVDNLVNKVLPKLMVRLKKKPPEVNHGTDRGDSDERDEDAKPQD